MSEPLASAAPLSRLPLHDLHVARGAKLVPFAGYSMPVQYAAGVLKEHQHTRSAAGLFDVSHMGQTMLRPRSGRVEDAARALERLVPADIVALSAGRQRYAVFTTETGGIIDDLMVANFGDHLFLVVNAACKAGDIVHLRTHLSDVCDIDVLEERVLVALQGPLAADVLAKISPTTVAIRFMDAGCHVVAGVPCLVSRSGYTGEDGYELSIPADRALEVVERLLANKDVMLIGLGARDSLRLEAGLCLYDQDIDATTTPVEAALEWTIARSRRPGGGRSGGFPGADVVLAQLCDGAPRRRVGLSPEGRAPVRTGAAIFRDDLAAQAIGQVTSGGFGPSVNRPVAMGYLPADLAAPGTRVFADVRGQRLSMRVAMLPFVPHNYKR
jgi:glycine cleavage system T protein (aminomethyltransferase)